MEEELERALEGLRMAGIDLARAVESLWEVWPKAIPSTSTSQPQSGNEPPASGYESPAGTHGRLVELENGAGSKSIQFMRDDSPDTTAGTRPSTLPLILPLQPKYGATTEAGGRGQAPRAALPDLVKAYIAEGNL